MPKAIICDLDGTLALLGDRNPYDASTAENDELNIVVEMWRNELHLTCLQVDFGEF